jgi:serine protease Do
MGILGKRRGLVLALLFLFAGIAAGLTISSRLGIMTDGRAGEKTDKSVSVKASPVVMGLSNGLADVAGAVIPVVVNISTTKIVHQENPMTPFFSDPFFRKFFGEPNMAPNRDFRERSLGSGVIVSSDGYIITNNHVVAGADEISVALSDKREFKGKIIGTDPRSDVAVIKIDATGLPSVTWGDSDKLRPGELVMAVGSPFGLTRTVTVGIISALGRANVGITDYEDFIQTDAAINPGNSGGPLVNMEGELVGINTAIFSRTGGYQGIGFAVPSNMAKQVMDSLIKTGKVVRGWLGVSVQDLTPELAKQFGVPDVKGALVGEVVADSPAQKAGLKQGDVVVGYGGKQVMDSGHLRNMVAGTPVGNKVDLDIIRDKKKDTLTVKIGELPKEMAGAEGGEVSVKDSVLAGVKVVPLSADLRDKLGLDKSVTGVIVSSVQAGSTAEDAGLAAGDVIVSINREQVNNVDDYNKIASELHKDEPVLLLVNRKGSMLWMSIEAQ